MRNSGVTRPVLGATIAGWIMGGLAVPAMAEDAIPPAVQRRLEELEQKVRTLERQQEVSEEVRTADKAKQTATVSAGADGFALKSTDGAFQLKLRGLLHADSRWFFDSDDPTSDDTFTLRRVRPYIEGTVFNIFDFRFMPDFAGGKTVIQDAYVDARFLPWLQIKGGKFKTPFGIERLQSASAIRFVERALPNNLVPNRDIGGELHGELGGGVFSYSLAGLNGVNDGRSSDDIGDIDNNVDKDFAGRIFAHPFQNTSIVPLQGLGIRLWRELCRCGRQSRRPQSAQLPDLGAAALLRLSRHHLLRRRAPQALSAGVLLLRPLRAPVGIRQRFPGCRA